MNDIDKLKLAWNKLILEIGKALHLDKLLDWITKKLG